MKSSFSKKILTLYLFCTLMSILIYSTISFILGSELTQVSVSWLAIITSVVSILYILYATDHIYGHSLAFLVYLIFTQFGTCFVIFVFPLTELPMGGYYYTDWIHSKSYPLAILLGIIAVSTFTLIVVWMGNKISKYKKCNIELKKTNTKYYISYRPIAWIGLLIVGLVFLFLVYLVITGSINLTGSYLNFLQYSQSNVGLWSIAMLFLPMGFAFVVTMGNKTDIKILLVLYGVISVILLLTGNKGEVLYAVLAGFGVYCYKKNKISKSVLITGLFTLLIIIPTITLSRNESVFDMLGSYALSISDPLVEMGYQIRLSVFMIDGVSNGTRDYLLGFSYYDPLVNIINRFFPFIPRLTPPIDFDFQTTYDTMGFSQVAESYANFGLLGVFIFFSILGLILAKFDNVDKLSPRSALYAGWIIIFINMTRNVFAFVIGQMFIVFVIWKISVLISNSIKSKKIINNGAEK